MGKRELALILGFVVAGLIVWQVTAPKSEGPGFSLSDFMSNARREMRGRNASAEVKTTPAIPVDASINEIRLTLRGNVTIVGEERADVAAELTVVSNGHDEAEARQLATDTRLDVSKFADSVVLAYKFPEPGRQEASLTLRVPARLRIQLDGRGADGSVVSGVSTVTLARTTGTLELKQVVGLVKGEHRGGALTIDGAQAVDLYAVSSETVIRNIREDVQINARGGEARIESTPGRVTITAGDTRVRVDGPTGELRAEVTEADLELRDVSSAIDVDARSTPVSVAWARAATSKIQVRDGSLELTLPADASSYSLDARASNGELRVPDSLTKSTDGAETAVTKNASAGAPAIFVRGAGATITIR